MVKAVSSTGTVTEQLSSALFSQFKPVNKRAARTAAVLSASFNANISTGVSFSCSNLGISVIFKFCSGVAFF